QYAKRDETRREHLQELLERFELRQFDRSYYRELIDWLMPLALQTTQGMVLAHAVANELRAPDLITDRRADRKNVCHCVDPRGAGNVPKVDGRAYRHASNRPRFDFAGASWRQ